MKEATGELNMTVIVAISVGILATFFFTVIWPMINANFQRESQCRSAVCNCSKDNIDADNTCLCWTKNDKSNTFRCPWKG